MEICDNVTLFVEFVDIVTMGSDCRRMRLGGNIHGPHTCGGVTLAVEGERWVVVMVDGDGCAGKCDIVSVITKLA